ncbi:MAG TPA: hypothetical protein VMU04_13250 [Candidatus Acidoferrum sp.]|nr:hypothetical protein [Candidatus Acidoferrum sp.]
MKRARTSGTYTRTMPPGPTQTDAPGSALAPDEPTRELLRRVESGRPLTLAEYVRAEEVLKAAPPRAARELQA